MLYPFFDPPLSCCIRSLILRLKHLARVKATLGDLSGIEQYLAEGGSSSSKTFDMVDGGLYDGDKVCEFFRLEISRVCSVDPPQKVLHLVPTFAFRAFHVENSAQAACDVR